MRALLLCLLLAACGGGGGSSSGGNPPPPEHAPPPEGVHTFADFFPHLSGKSGSATAVWLDGRLLATYTFTPFSATWGQSIERWAIANCNGAPWAVVLGYEQVGGPLWEASSDQTLWDGEPVVCERGAAYAPINITPGTHTIKQWGQISHERRYFWQSEITTGISITNPCWQGEGDKTRPTLGQREVWLDEGGAQARGTVIGDPWANNTFFQPQVVYGFQGYAGLGVGTLWYGTDPTGGPFCLQSVTFQ